MNPFTIDIPALIAANRAAIADKTLLAAAGIPLCVYDDGCGHGCAIGVALPQELRDQLRKNDRAGISFASLVTNNWVTDDANFRLLDFTQILHDTWSKGNSLQPRWLDAVPAWAQAWAEPLEDQKVTQDTFESWLDALEFNHAQA